MTDIDRLTALLMAEAGQFIGKNGTLNCSKLAEKLLEHGVIVLPCKVGDTIYRCGDPIKKVYEWEIEHVELYFDEIIFVDDSDNEFTAEDIGKTVFLTKAEAEQVLNTF